jgi:hypothetical protein
MRDGASDSRRSAGDDDDAAGELDWGHAKILDLT